MEALPLAIPDHVIIRRAYDFSEIYTYRARNGRRDEQHDYNTLMNGLKNDSLPYTIEISTREPEDDSIDFDDIDDDDEDWDEDESFNQKDRYNLSDKPTESIEAFISQCCRQPNRGSLENSILKAKYTEWCNFVGIDELSPKTFKKIMNLLGFEQNNDPERSWKNLSLFH